MKSRIRKVRNDANLSQEQMASELNLSKNFISQIETGSRNPSDRTICDICKKFHVSEEWLRNGTGEPYLPIENEEAAYVAELLSDKDNPVYDLIKSIMKTYSQLSDNNKLVLQEFCQKLKENQ
ncbi:MAG: helix-turn-helix transcriptional regulator [Oscillospiraceae bacterium]|nr:helix-turn-helix transcriptional regulator [Oscillospiraceae bacterium]